jgi:hypothetical protein
MRKIQKVKCSKFKNQQFKNSKRNNWFIGCYHNFSVIGILGLCLIGFDGMRGY